MKDKSRGQLTYPIPSHVNFWFCFGGFAFFLIVLQVLTGAFMMFFYVPIAENAQASIKYLCNNIPYGGLIRNFYPWRGTLIVVFLSFYGDRDYTSMGLEELLGVDCMGRLVWCITYNW